MSTAREAETNGCESNALLTDPACQAFNGLLDMNSIGCGALFHHWIIAGRRSFLSRWSTSRWCVVSWVLVQHDELFESRIEPFTIVNHPVEKFCMVLCCVFGFHRAVVHYLVVGHLVTEGLWPGKIQCRIEEPHHVGLTFHKPLMACLVGLMDRQSFSSSCPSSGAVDSRCQWFLKGMEQLYSASMISYRWFGCLPWILNSIKNGNVRHLN